MNSRILTTFLAATVLAGCSGGTAETANNEAAVEAPSAPEAPAVTPASAAAGGAPTADYMVGKWSAIDEDCADTLEFRKDGTLTTPIAEAKWTLVGDELTMDYGDGSKQKPSKIKVLSQERIEITRGSGGKETAIRC